MEINVAAVIHKRLQRLLHASWVAAGFLLGSNLVLAFVIDWMWFHEKIIVTPPMITQAFTVSNSQVDANYLQMMTLFWLSLRLNVTPETITQQHKLLLSYADSAFYAQFHEVLTKEHNLVKKERISSIFYPEIEHIIINLNRNQVTLSGILKRWVGNMELPLTHKTYNLQFNYHNSSLSVREFNLIGEIHEKI